VWDTSQSVTVPSKKLPRGASLLDRAPHLVREWAEKNVPVLPRDVHAGSPNGAWWECVEGHTWFSTIRDRVRKGAGCPFCAGKLASPTNCLAFVAPETVKMWHPSKNLPETPWTVVAKSSRKFWWLCGHGHEWFAPPHNVVGLNSGCPRCVNTRDSRREQACRIVLEQLTGHSFPKTKPDWLRSRRGYQLEFDGYSESLGVAFEHHGIQHFEYVRFFHRFQKFERTQELDAEKRSRAAEHGVTLIEVRWDCQDIPGYLSEQLERFGFASGGV